MYRFLNESDRKNWDGGFKALLAGIRVLMCGNRERAQGHQDISGRR